jgi:hypothetical protein
MVNRLRNCQSWFHQDALAIPGSAEIASIAANQNNRRWILCFIGPPFALVLNV